MQTDKNVMIDIKNEDGKSTIGGEENLGIDFRDEGVIEKVTRDEVTTNV